MTLPPGLSAMVVLIGIGVPVLPSGSPFAVAREMRLRACAGPAHQETPS